MELISRQFRASAPLWPLVMLRLLGGWVFLKAGWGKVQRGADFIPGMEGFITRNLEAGNPYGFFRPILESVVMKAPALFAYMVAWGELFLGIALLLGVLTRLSSYLGAFMVAAFLFTKGHSLTLLSHNNYDTIWMLILLTLGLCAAGRTFGLDRYLLARKGESRWLW